MLDRSSRHIALAIAAVTGLSLAAQPATVSRAAAGIPVGVVADLSGTAAIYGVSIQHGVQLAADQINARGGIKGRPVNVMIDDAASQVSQVQNLYQQDITAKHVVAIIGPTLSSEAFKADPIAQGLHTPVVATSNTAAGITKMGNYIFRMSLGEADVIPLTLKAAEAHLHFKHVAIIYANDNAFTLADGQVFQAVAKKMGLKVVDTETYATTDKDFSTQLTKIKNAKPDAILCGALKEGAQVLIQARQLGIPSSVHFIGGNGFNSPAIISAAGKAAEGAIEGTAWFANGKSRLNQSFIKAYKARYKTAPDQFAAQAYDGMNIVVAALKKARSITPQAVRDALAAVKNVPVVTGASGTFSFTSTRDANEKGTVQIIRNGQFVEYK